MSGIHDILDQVRARETRAADAVTAAKREAAAVLMRAEDEGRAARDAIIRRAEEESREIVALARREAGEISARLAADSTCSLDETDRKAAVALDGAVTRLLGFFADEAGV